MDPIKYGQGAGNFGAAATPPYVTSGATASQTAIEYLAQTKPWVRLISVLIFVGVFVMALAVIVGLAASAALGSRSGVAALPILTLIPLGLLYLYPGLALSRYAKAIARLQQTESLEDLEEALSQQKSFWRFVGIVTLITLCIYAAGFVLLFVMAPFALR